MQAQTPEVSTEKATTPRYDTIVIKGAKGQNVPKEVDGGEVVAWSVGHGLAAMDALEEFIEDLAAGNCNQPAHLTQGAADAINLMRRRRSIGWEADEPTDQPPADWKTSVAQAVATARKVFGESADDAMQAIEYMAGLLLSREPEVDTARLDFMLEKHRKVVVELIPGKRHEVYVEEGFMGEEQSPAVIHVGDWTDGSLSAKETKRKAIDVAIAAQQQGGEA